MIKTRLFKETKEYDAYFNYFLVIFCVYCLDLFTLVQANFNQTDDIGRVAWGFKGWEDYGRYLSVFLSAFIHGDYILNDISPLPQIIAVLIITTASIIMIKLFSSDDGFSFNHVLAVLPLGLSPYFYDCLSYKFDAPYMALSVLFSVLPLAYIEKKLVIYFVVAFVCTLCMLLTYQAASGIFLLTVCFWLFINWNQGKYYRWCVKRLAASCLAFFFSCTFFKLFLVQERSTYVSTEIANLESIFSTVLQNIRTYSEFLYSDANVFWLVIYGFLVCLCVFTVVRGTFRNKAVVLTMTVFLIIGGWILSYGGYLVLKKPLFEPRAMFGFGAYIALVGLMIVRFINRKYIATSILLPLCISYLLFGFACGKAMNEQQKADRLLAEQIINDLSKIPNLDNKHIRKMQIKGDGKPTFACARLFTKYPVAERFIRNRMQAGYYYSEFYLYHYYGLPGVKQILCYKLIPELNESAPIDDTILPILNDNSDYTIKANQKEIVVLIKEM